MSTKQVRAGRLELVPPAAPEFSPETSEEVIMRMRRVVTGEQVAQIYNPDPFARPVFRAPVYQTPAGLILLAWLIPVPVSGWPGSPSATRPRPRRWRCWRSCG